MEYIKFFYKYQSFDENVRVLEGKDKVLENLEQNQLYFSCPTTFNDPFDCRMQCYLEGTEAEWIRYLKSNGLNHKQGKELLKFNIKRCWFTKKEQIIYFDPTHEDYRRTQDDSFHGDFHSKNLPFVSCFSEVNNNILMWSHYANDHKGICLGFKAKKIQDKYILFLDSRLPIDFSKVSYHEVMPPRFNMLHVEERVKYILQALTTKFISWEYEKEWRMIVFRDEFKNENRKDDNRGSMKYDKNNLESITFGLKISRGDAESVCKILHEEYWEKGIMVKLYQAKEVQGKYSLQIESIDDVDKYLASLS